MPRLLRHAIVATFLAPLCLAAVPAHAAIHALVVGIDEYSHVNGLEGAVNDARDLAATLKGRGAQVEVLLNRQATRSAIVAALRRIVARARPGDSVVFTYAGHGGQQREALPGDEADGLDEIYLLANFDFSGPGANERLRDNDIAALLSEIPRDVGVLLVADSCHSGTMIRDAELPLGRSRSPDIEPLPDDPLPPPSSQTYQVEMSSLPQILFAAASRDDQKTLEVPIDGRQRGALSWSIARALEGRANAGKGTTGLADLRAFVRVEVRQRTFGRQDADIVFAPELETPGSSPAAAALFELFNPNAKPGSAPNRIAEAGPELALAAEPAIHQLGKGENIEAVGSDKLLIWQQSRPATLLDRASGDLLGRPADEAALTAAVLKWRAARGLERWVSGRPADPRLAEGDGRHKVGEMLSLVLRPPENAPEMRYVTLANLASTGAVQYVFPDATHEAQGRDRIPEGSKEFRLGTVPVIEPVGADSLLAIFTPTRPAALRKALRNLSSGPAAPEALLKLLRTEAADPKQARIGLLTIYTGDAQ